MRTTITYFGKILVSCIIATLFLDIGLFTAFCCEEDMTSQNSASGIVHFWQTNKHWLQPAAYVFAIVGVGFGLHYCQPSFFPWIGKQVSAGAIWIFYGSSEEKLPSPTNSIPSSSSTCSLDGSSAPNVNNFVASEPSLAAANESCNTVSTWLYVSNSFTSEPAKVIANVTNSVVSESAKQTVVETVFAAEQTTAIKLAEGLAFMTDEFAVDTMYAGLQFIQNAM